MLTDSAVSDLRFDARTVLVTGGSSGIGAACARRFSLLGASVVLGDIAFDRANQVAGEICESGGSAIAIELDVSNSKDWLRVREVVRETFGPVSVVHNNAFARVLKPAHETSEDEWNQQLSVNLGAVYRSIHTFVEDLTSTGGSITNTASVHSDLGFRSHPGYAASKGGIVALTQQLAVEYGPQIRVNAVLPGPIATAAWDGADDSQLVEAANGTAMLRLGSPEEVANAVVFLASPAASYITGASLRVDGGYTIRKVLSD